MSGTDKMNPGDSAEGVEEQPLTRSSVTHTGSKQIFVDHFTLPVHSSNVRFRSTNNRVHVFSNHNSQFILEEDWDNDKKDGEHKITAKKVSDATSGLKFLRATYTLVCLFFTGFLCVFSIELLLFLVLDVMLEVGATSKQDANVFYAMGTIAALPVYVHGLASALVIAGHYVADAWQGHALVKRFVFGRFNGVLTEWISFFVFLGIPVLTICFTLLSGSTHWWTISALVWFALVFVFYMIFCGTIVWFENRACMELMANQFDDDLDTWYHLIRRSLLLRQNHRFAGTKHVAYFAKGAIEDAKGSDSNDHVYESSRVESMSWFTKLTQMDFLQNSGLFKTLDEPHRVYSIQDAQDVRPYVTANTWGLEKLYCRPHHSRYVAIIKGPDALTKAQMKSSFVCAIIGNFFCILLTACALAWLGLPGILVIVAVALVVVFGLLPGMRVSYRIYRMTKDLIFELDGDDEEDLEAEADSAPTEKEKEETTERNLMIEEHEDCEGVFQVWESYRLTEPTELFCWIMFALEVIFFFIIPAASLFAIGNITIALVFMFVAFFGGVREWFNAALVLEEMGRLDLLKKENESANRTWQTQSRINTIVTNISRSGAHKVWMTILCVCLTAFLGLFAIAINSSGDTSSGQELNFLPDFKYEQAEDLEYPTCSFGKGLEALGSPTTDMADYAFVAGLAYKDSTITQGELDGWFGDGTTTDMNSFVEQYRSDVNVTSEVSFKLIRFEESNLGLVAIRGTTNAFDALADAQLWSAAAVFQFLRLLLPFGEMWTPILDSMVTLVSTLESETISKIAFYKDTSAFVNFLKSGEGTEQFSNVQVTGHSLGGGLSMITGAQTNTAAIALSGPNAMISRKTFDPPLDKETLNTKVFNIIPDRDIVPMLDDHARLFQQINCTAPFNDFVGCHNGLRSLCEIIHTCGTKARPALCECTRLFDYPEPIPTGIRTFAEACPLDEDYEK